MEKRRQWLWLLIWIQCRFGVSSLDQLIWKDRRASCLWCRAFWFVYLGRLRDHTVGEVTEGVWGTMLVLLILLLIGLFAGIWGFMMCFLPAQWDRLTAIMSFAGRWTEPSSKRPHPLIRLINRIAGLAICVVGCWFAYMAASEIYLVLAGGLPSHMASPASATLPNSPAPATTALAVFMLVAGTLMAVFPAKAVAASERVWPAGRSVTRLAAPKVRLFVRLCGGLFVFLAMMSLIH